tara:strand:+ start:1210 stop:2307 length:1098 start_codon:yes stop_codon:yes gene_type:complete
MDDIKVIIEMLYLMNKRSVLKLERNNKLLKVLFIEVQKGINKKEELFKIVKTLRNRNKKQQLRLKKNHILIKKLFVKYKSITVDPEEILKEEVEKLQLEVDILRRARGIREKTSEEIKINKKAALLIGINYQGTRNELGGCENDIYDMKAKLMVTYGILEEDILVLTEKESKQPTYANIIYGINWLVEKNREGYKNIWFQYSGHGYYKKDRNGDELDGKDECLVTVDTKFITDDVLKTNLVNRMSDDVNMICIMDCCHSGTIMDLKYKYKRRGLCELQYNDKDSKNIISVSGCRDNQTSADAWFTNKWNGALTKKLMIVLERSNYAITNMNLLSELQTELSNDKFSQRPVITASRRLTENTPFVI